MVAETQDTMTKMFDSMNESFRSTMDACRRNQESWFKSFGDTTKTALPFDACGFGFQNASTQWIPFMKQSVDTFNDTVDATFGAGMKAAKTAVTTIPTTDNGDFAKNAQKAFDAAITAFGTNMDALNKACARHTENYTKLMQSSWSCATPSKGCDTKGSGKSGHK